MYAPVVRCHYFSLAVVSFSPVSYRMLPIVSIDAAVSWSARCSAGGGRYKTRVPRVTGIGKDSDPNTLNCMLDNCKQEVIDCAKDSDCRACISCLTSCPPNDQAREIRGVEAPLPPFPSGFLLLYRALFILFVQYIETLLGRGHRTRKTRIAASETVECEQASERVAS